MTSVNILMYGMGNEQLMITQGFGGLVQSTLGGGMAFISPELVRRRRVTKEKNYLLVIPIIQKREISRTINLNILKTFEKKYKVNTRLTYDRLIELLDSL